MSYDAIRERLARQREQQKDFSDNEKVLLDALHQLTVVLESDLTQIKVALGHVARLLEARRN
jgi:flagellar motor switch protein FliM